MHLDTDEQIAAASAYVGWLADALDHGYTLCIHEQRLVLLIAASALLRCWPGEACADGLGVPAWLEALQEQAL